VLQLSDWARENLLQILEINANAHWIAWVFPKIFARCRLYFLLQQIVYGDTPNSLPLVEMETRWELPKSPVLLRIDENILLIIRCIVCLAHQISRWYSGTRIRRYFGLKTAHLEEVFNRPLHQGAEYTISSISSKCIAMDKEYTIYAYKGKQVRIIYTLSI